MSGTLDLGDGNTLPVGDDLVATHTYAAAGDYVITFTPADGAAASSTTVTAVDRVSLEQHLGSATDLVLDASLVAGYVAGISDVHYIIDAGADVYATAIAQAGLQVVGGTAGDTITIDNNGTIRGCGGASGVGQPPSDGGAGGWGMRIATGCPWTLNNSGTIIGGGGGGGGGGGSGHNFYAGVGGAGGIGVVAESQGVINNLANLGGGGGGGGATGSGGDGSGGGGGGGAGYGQRGMQGTNTQGAPDNATAGDLLTGGIGGTSIWGQGGAGGNIGEGGGTGGQGAGGGAAGAATSGLSVLNASAGSKTLGEQLKVIPTKVSTAQFSGVDLIGIPL